MLKKNFVTHFLYPVYKNVDDTETTTSTTCPEGFYCPDTRAPSFGWDGTSGSPALNWSAPARLLPFLEDLAVGAEIQRKLGEDYHVATLSNGSLISGLRIPVLLCPAEKKDELRIDNADRHYPLNYAVNLVNMSLQQLWNIAYQAGFEDAQAIMKTDRGQQQ